ncbi:hypothetical protein [Microcoleus asticus]|uniref:hypothetical protein n=1 Tax=Microcoleus asticus TaxID=2815231 RepID=UPI001557F43E|nr:hypothetical protein [Microcoleus asticus]
MTNLWGGQSNLAKLRNDVLHAGFRKNPKSAEKILNETDEIIEELNAISREWKLTEDNN